MATDDVEFVAILTLRYMEPHLMGLAHDWVEQNAPTDYRGDPHAILPCRAETQKGVTSPNLQFGD